MPNADTLIRTKLRLPFTRPELVPRPALQERIAQGLRGPLTLIVAPAGFGKTTLAVSSISGCEWPAAWLSLDENDNQPGRFLNYLVAALQGVEGRIGVEAAQLMAGMRQAPSETVLTSLVNDLDAIAGEIILALDDYQFIRSQAVHAQVAFLLEHCPQTFHLLIASRSDPPLPLARLRARGQMVELRATDLGFSESEAAQFLNGVMGLGLDAGAVAVLETRTEGWIAGLQMAALALQGTRSMRDREGVSGFIQGFSGTNRYILDYLLEEVLARQAPEIQRFLLHTSILERLTASLCDAVLADGQGPRSQGDDRSTHHESHVGGPSTSTLEYVERANLFLVPLDDERIWYRYHQLFADLLRAQLQRSLGALGVAQLHIRAADWHAQNGSTLEAIHHASMASDEKRVERFIEQHYREMVSRGEMSGYRFWTGRLSKELVYGRPWLCIYEAYSHAWFGELDEAERFLVEAEKYIRSESSTPDARSMRGHLAYIKSRVTAMRGDIDKAIELCLAAREYAPVDNPAVQFDTLVTLGYEYFLSGDYTNASRILREAIRSSIASGAVIYTVAASCFLARLYAVQGLLKKSYNTYQRAAEQIPEASGEHRDARALVEVGLADLLCEWNDLDAALLHLQQGLALLHLWGKVDDLALAYVTLARIHLAQANQRDARKAVKEATEVIQTSGVFPEARRAHEIAQIKLWLAQGDIQAATHWSASQEERLGSDDRFRFENELTQIAQARVSIAQNRPAQASGLLSHLEEAARLAGRMGRVIEILVLKALATQEMGNSEQALLALSECLTLAEPEGYVRIFLDEGPPMQRLLAQWLAHAGPGPLRDYAFGLLSHFDAELPATAASPADQTLGPVGPKEQPLVEPLSERELEVLHLIARGKTNPEIAEQLVVARGTVKAHAAHIYRKLDVTNRTEAVSRARQLGILP